MKKIIISSKNPVKIKATIDGFRKMFPEQDFEIEGISVSSDVSDQPMSDSETMLGAYNRATKASANQSDADFWVGIEGGIEDKNLEMESFAWVVIKSLNKVGKGRTGTFLLPEKVSELIRKGKELGEANDIVFGMTNSKQKGGAIGILTNNLIDRSQFYTEAVILALISFKNEDLY